MEERGLAARPMPDVVTTDSFSINQLLGMLEAGYWSACWSLDAATRRLAAEATREWARQEFGDLDLPREHVEATVWRAYPLT